MSYEAFLKRKMIRFQGEGVETSAISDHLFPFQQEMVRWAIGEAEARARAEALRWLASLLTTDWHPSPAERRWLRAQAEETGHE